MEKLIDTWIFQITELPSPFRSDKLMLNVSAETLLKRNLEYACCYRKNREQCPSFEVIFVLKKTSIQKYVLLERGKIVHFGFVTTPNLK